jgi:peptidoglycan/LPS O-acetylase OafA/YrhL
MKSPLHISIPPNRIYGLDIMRASAILLVLLAHSRRYLPASWLSYYDPINLDGVSIFFVLSGFLIGGILIKTVENKEITFNTLFTFWKNRWLRTIPPYLFVLCFLVLIYYKYFPAYIMLQYFIFSENILKPTPNFFPEAWSLSVEEWFYLTVPVLIFIISKFLKPKYSILIVAIFILISVTLYRYIKFEYYPIKSFDDFDLNFKKIVFTRLDAIMYGLIGAYMAYYQKGAWLKNKGIKFILGIMMLVIHQFTINDGSVPFTVYDTVFNLSVVSIGTMLLLPYLSELKTGKGIVFNVLTKISLISYSLYLLNYSVVTYFSNKIKYHIHFPAEYVNWVSLIFYWGLSITGAILMYKYIEIPSMNLRHKKKIKV